VKADWRTLVKTVVITALITTGFWFAMAMWWVQHQSPAPEPPHTLSRPQMLPTGPRNGSDAPTFGGEPRLIVPVVGVRPEHLVDTFTQARASGTRRHDAIDILAPRGAPVIAAAAGKVEKLFLSKEGGNTIYIRSPDGRWLFYYAHLDHYQPGLVEGMAIEQGAMIGSVGSTGNADPAAPHLHFAVWMTSPDRKWWEEATALNPYELLKQS
jgi:murein DD-endopeptidase MepM/ murein hydrolase activator NlpD